MIKERLALSYQFLRFPANYALVLVPAIISLLTFFNTNKVKKIDSNLFAEVSKSQQVYIDNYLIMSITSFMVLCSFFIVYRWSSMQSNRVYGYWLTQGVDRKLFLILSISVLIVLGYFGIWLGLLLLITIGGVSLGFGSFSVISILLFIKIAQVVIIGVIIADLIPNSEIALLSYMTGYGILYLFVSPSTNVFAKFVFGELHYQQEVFLSILLSFSFMSIAFAWVYYYHMRKDVEL
ncbi:MAG: hypothetical protein INQ03_12710 [Candidatus Heimdallarchaeota archaeon]|nr:hypothetical protein [Candidatus Heimdallarchaeota archaeon]